MAGKKGNIFGGVSQILGFAIAGVAAIALGYFMGNLVIDYMMSGSSQEVQRNVDEVGIDDSMDQLTAQVSMGDQIVTTQEPAASAGQTKPQASAQQSRQTQAQSNTQKSSEQSASKSVSSGTTSTGGSQATVLYRVQVGAFSSRERAEALAEKLKGEGYSVFVTTTSPYKVQVGAFANRNNAAALSKELNEKGYETFITQ